MLNFPCPTLDPTTTIAAIINSKREPRLTRLRGLLGVIQTRTDAFELEFATLERLAPIFVLSPQDVDDLCHLYESSTAPMERLREDLFRNIPKELQRYCPFCGIDRCHTLDHYLPRTAYPEFAVHPWNLMPCCDRCNRIKSTQVLDSSSKRLVFNIYSDVISTTSLLKASVALNANNLPRATFILDQTATVSVTEMNAMNRHLTALGLFDEYASASNEYFSEIVSSLREHHARANAARIIHYLEREANRYQNLFNINHWRSVLLRGMADSPTFVNYLVLQIR